MLAKTTTKPVEDKIGALIADDLAAAGYELVRVKLLAGGSYMTLQVMAERLDGKGMTVDDCVRISHVASERLDTDATIADRYTLEVSSPGIDRPLIRLKDYERFTGHLARIELDAPRDGQKRFQGSIVRVSGREPDAEIEFHTDKGDVRVPMQSIAHAKLVMTEALLGAQDTTKH